MAHLLTMKPYVCRNRMYAIPLNAFQDLKSFTELPSPSLTFHALYRQGDARLLVFFSSYNPLRRTIQGFMGKNQNNVTHYTPYILGEKPSTTH